MILTLQLFSLVLSFLNPFQIPFEDKKEIKNRDVEQIQTLLRKVNIQRKLVEFYPVDLGFFEKFEPLKEFESRVSRCLKQVLIDPQKGLWPVCELVKINEGGKDCFVLSCPYNGIYPQLLKSLIQGLRVWKKLDSTGTFITELVAFPIQLESRPNGLEYPTLSRYS